MLKYFFLALIFYHSKCLSQISVQNTKAGVFQESPLIAYIGIDNPITITTGSNDVVKVTVKNGIIISAGGNGKYWLRPQQDQMSNTITITVQSEKEKQDFIFEVHSIPYPEVQFGGTRNDDNMFDNFRIEAKGIFCSNKNFHLTAKYKIDSFDLIIYHPIDSSSVFRHINYGPAWDNLTSNEIRKAPKGSFVLIKEVWIIGPDGRQFILKPNLKGYINE